MGQKSAVASALPAGMGSLLGFSSLGDLASMATSKATASITGGDNNNSGGGMGWLKWALPLVALAGLAWWWTSKSKTPSAEDIAAKAQMVPDSNC